MAPTLRIVFDEWLPSSPGAGLTRVPRFIAYRSGDYLFPVVVRLRVSFAQTLLEGRYKDDAQRGRLEAALLRFAVPRIETGLQAGAFSSEPTSEHQVMTVEQDDLFHLEALLVEKTCHYQVVEDRDLYCSAAAEADSSVVGLLGLRRLAPTTRPICRECNLPTTEVICSHLLHPSVTVLNPIGSPRTRFVNAALCDKGRSEVDQDPGACRANGHACWERIVGAAEVASEPVVSPLALPEQLDFLDAVWQVAFRRPLLQLGGATHVAGLALGCRTREEFTARLTNLAGALDSLDVPPDLLPLDEGKRGALNRVETFALQQAGGDSEAQERIEASVTVLRNLVRIRVGLQHGDAAKRLPHHFSQLQLPYPPTDWATTWNQVQARAVDALARLRDDVRRMAAG